MPQSGRTPPSPPLSPTLGMGTAPPARASASTVALKSVPPKRAISAHQRACSPLGVRAEEVLETTSTADAALRTIKVSAGPSATMPGNELLSSAAGIAVDEEYSKDERMLNEFTKQHPMLSMEASSVRTMQLVANMMEKAHVTTAELPEVKKSHDDLYLSPANTAIGERPCVCGDRCLCVFMAKLRYGPDTDKGFVCKEFLLPKQRVDFLAGKGLPPLRQKCLVCTRYYTTYLYLLARTDPNFKIAPSVAIQTFCNAVEPTPNASSALPDHAELIKVAHEVPSHTSTVACVDGYKPHAMLFVDEEFSQNRIQRETRMGTLMFRPVVRFNSAHYRYVSNSDGSNPRLVQVGIGHDDHLGGLGFREPPLPEATAGAAAQHLLRSH